jgi:hypothetical protein
MMDLANSWIIPLHEHMGVIHARSDGTSFWDWRRSFYLVELYSLSLPLCWVAVLRLYWKGREVEIEWELVLSHDVSLAFVFREHDFETTKWSA